MEIVIYWIIRINGIRRLVELHSRWMALLTKAILEVFSSGCLLIAATMWSITGITTWISLPLIGELGWAGECEAGR